METPRLRTALVLGGVLIALLAFGISRCAPTPATDAPAPEVPAPSVAPTAAPHDAVAPREDEAAGERRRHASVPPRADPPETATLDAATVEQLNASLDSYARMLEHAWSVGSWGGDPGHEFRTLDAPGRAWLREQLLGLPFGHKRLPAVIWAVSLELGDSEDSQLPHLAAWVRGEDAYARQRAMEVLATVPYAVPRDATELYARLLRVATDGSAAEQVPALLALSGLRAEGIDALGDLQSAYESGSGAVRAAALRGLANLDRVPPTRVAAWPARGDAALPFLPRALEDERSVVQIAALELVRRQPLERARPHEVAVARLLASSERAVRMAATETLQQLGEISVDTARALVGLLADEVPEVANNAMWALGNARRGSMVPIGRLTAGLTAEQPVLPCSNVICIRQHGRDGASATDALLSTIRHGQPFTREHAIQALHAVAPGHEPAYELLVACTGHPYQPTQAAAATALGEFGPRAIPHLVRLVGQDVRGVGDAAAHAIPRAAPVPHEEPAVWDAMDTATGSALVALAQSVAAGAPDDPRFLDALERIRADKASRALARKRGLDLGDDE